MKHVSEAVHTQSEADGLLIGKAVIRAGQFLGLKQAEVAQIIGLSAPQVSKIKDGKAPVTGKAAELSLYLIRVFRSLDAITGGDSAVVKAWMRNDNDAVGEPPARALQTAAGLVGVMTYLDAARAPL
ncbi:MAG: antitoxin Xre/MbcA/ParS toxin-binding domain-containing protein [Pseudomonadota bacterium]